MALLGYPREHMVPRETWRPWRTQPNPPRILTLEPERSEPIDCRGHDSGLSFGPARSSGLWLQIFGVERFSFLPDMQSDGRNLARQGQASQLGLHPLYQEVFVEGAKRPVAATGGGGRALKQVLQIVVMVEIQAADEHRLFAALQLAVHHLVVGAAARLQRQAAVGAELALAAKAMRRLHPPDQQSNAYRAEPRDGAQQLRLVMLATLQN